MPRVQTGLESFLQAPPAWAGRARLGLLSHPAAVGPDLTSARELLAARFPGQLQVLFSPQHGLLGEKQDNMIASADFVDPVLQLPVVSLYGPRLAPPADALAAVDAVLVDMQDVGTRVYTFAATLAKLMETAAPLGKKVVVLDRPNPIGSTVEGNLLRPEWASLVGPYPLPMRHGFTLGELARYYRSTQRLDCDLEVVPLQGWRRGDYFDATGLPWVLPSPNLPTLDGCLVYPGQVLLEGTNLSEGRGTTRPFELFGAPFLEPRRIKVHLQKMPELPGVILREAHFEPTFHKWAGEICQGFQLHVTDRQSFRPYYTTLALLAAIRELYPEQFAWRQPPYEYETERLPIDLLTGDAAIRLGLDQGKTAAELEDAWQEDLNRFREARREFLLYK